MRAMLAAALVCCAIVGLAGAEEAQAVMRRPTNIPAQALRPALQLLSKERDVQVVFRTDVVADMRTPGAVGELTVEEALKLLLSGTGLTFQYLDDKTVTIVPIATAPAAAAQSTAAAPLPALDEQLAAQQTDERKEKGFWRRLRLAQSATGSSGSDSPQDSESPSQDSEKKNEGLEEIIVTATKRAESIQNVPLSIAAVTAEEIDRRGLVSAEDYLRGIPGVNQTTGALGQSIIIRGIETSPDQQNFSSGATVATYFGEAPTTNSGGLNGGTNVDLKLVDIERVEVLRGPQGTAFGNSSLGGAVRTIPVAPKLSRLEGKAAASYSATSGTGGDNQMIQAIGNLPLLKDKLAIRATAYQFEQSGFYRNVAGSDPNFQTAAAQYAVQAFATDKDEVGASNFTGGRIAALFQANDDLKFTLSYLTQKTEADGQAYANTGHYEQAVLQVAPEHVVRGQKGGVFDTDIDLANAMVEYRLGWANLLASYTYTKSGSKDSLLTFAYSANLDWPFSELGTSEHREHVGEIRLTTQLDGAWNFLGGLYAEELEDQSYWNYSWFGSPASNFFGSDRFLGDYLDVRNLKQKAAFAEGSWEFAPRFTLTGGVRFYEFDRTGRVDQSGPVFGGVSSTPMAADASGTNFRGNLSHKFNDAVLVYAGWSQGFRLGKPQVGLPAGTCDLDSDGIIDGSSIAIDSTKSVDSDTVDSYELGGKFMLLDRRLAITADVYRIDWQGVPVRTTASCSNVTYAYNANAGAARSEGIELQTNFFVTKAFRVDIGGSWTNAELTKDAPGLAVPAFDGDRLPGSPKVNANLALQYEFSIGGYGGFVRADSTYVGTYFGNLQSSATTESGGYVKVDTLARMELGNLNIDLFVHNLTNADDFTFRGNFDVGSFFGYRLRPRTVGIQLGYRFE